MHAVNIRLPHEMKQALQVIADIEHRSLSNLIKTILLNYLKEQDAGSNTNTVVS
jgi:predicted transcriptional regulator